MGISNTYIKNSTHFVEKIFCIEIEEADNMVSFDVKSLFTMVPLDDAMTIIRDRLDNNDEWVVNTTMSAEQICYLTNPTRSNHRCCICNLL